MKYRYESFGGIVASDDPPFLAYVDRQFMRELGASPSPLWQGEEVIGQLSAPTEVHLCATNRCAVGCGHCYVGAGPADPEEADTATFKRMLDELASMNVFHIALGGGDALLREDIFELIAYTREVGLVPNLTVSGVGLTRKLAGQLGGLGQVNISLDGLGRRYGVYRNADHFDEVDRAIQFLVDAGVPTGINTVLGRDNFEHIESIVAYGVRRGVNEIEFLRLKPVGRGAVHARGKMMTHKQNCALWPTLSRLTEAFHLTLKVDCSFVPMLCYHQPDIELLHAAATCGCEAGNVLIGARSDGEVAGCSFLETTGMTLFDLHRRWHNNRALERLRRRVDHMAEPCRSCDFLPLCKGGCLAVSRSVHGDDYAPDPDCPIVVETAAP